MGRIFETRKSTMFARWDKMAKAFSRVARDISVAVKTGGPNPETNPALRRAIQNGRAVNMPKDKVDAAIKRASGQDQAAYEVLVYEGYAPHGTPVIIETATDNGTRTVANLRAILKKHGGSLGTTGSVSFLFRHMGVIRLAPAGIDQESLEMDLIDHGLEEMGEGTGEKGEPQIVLRCAIQDFGKLQSALEARSITPISAEAAWVPENLVEQPEDKATEILKMVDALEQDDDVQRIFHNLK